MAIGSTRHLSRTWEDLLVDTSARSRNEDLPWGALK